MRAVKERVEEVKGSGKDQSGQLQVA